MKRVYGKNSFIINIYNSNHYLRFRLNQITHLLERSNECKRLIFQKRVFWEDMAWILGFERIFGLETPLCKQHPTLYNFVQHKQVTVANVMYMPLNIGFRRSLTKKNGKMVAFGTETDVSSIICIGRYLKWKLTNSVLEVEVNQFSIFLRWNHCI
jgi:hypothetical protein